MKIFEIESKNMKSLIQLDSPFVRQLETLEITNLMIPSYLLLFHTPLLEQLMMFKLIASLVLFNGVKEPALETMIFGLMLELEHTTGPSVGKGLRTTPKLFLVQEFRPP